jgi:3-oxoacyl-[acyl-carrier protein] reductase
VLAVNLKGTFLAVQACLPAMSRQGYGRIAITSSITGPRVGQPRNAHYAASKAGMIGFMFTAAVEFAR